MTAVPDSVKALARERQPFGGKASAFPLRAADGRPFWQVAADRKAAA